MATPDNKNKTPETFKLRDDLRTRNTSGKTVDAYFSCKFGEFSLTGKDLKIQKKVWKNKSIVTEEVTIKAATSEQLKKIYDFSSAYTKYIQAPENYKAPWAGGVSK